MACGCNKNKNSISRGPAIRPGVYNRSSNGNIVAARSTQVRSQSVTPNAQNEGTSSAKRKVQALRREALMRAKGK